MLSPATPIFNIGPPPSGGFRPERFKRVDWPVSARLGSTAKPPVFVGESGGIAPEARLLDRLLRPDGLIGKGPEEAWLEHDGDRLAARVLESHGDHALSGIVDEAAHLDPIPAGRNNQSPHPGSPAGEESGGIADDGTGNDVASRAAPGSAANGENS